MPFPALPAPVDSSQLGATLIDDGCRFSVWAPRAHRVELALWSPQGQTNSDMQRNDDGTWSTVIPGISAGQSYGFRVHGPWDPETGQRFNPARLLLDPYAKAITGGVDYSGPIRDHIEHSNYVPEPLDSANAMPKSVVVAPSAAPLPIARRRALSEHIIYETHVKGFTASHPLVPEHLRGTYAGLAYPAVIEHFTTLGITAIQLLPIHHFISEPFIVGRGLTNFWGYNSMGFFAPHAGYAAAGTEGQQVQEFKDMVSALHAAGIEVFLDVVYNHTAEGSHQGPTLGFRGIDHAGYYRFTDDLRNDYDVTGCGNSLNSAQPGVRAMILDSMRYWATQMGIDGFRFDLATTLIRNERHEVDQHHPFKQEIAADPVLSQLTMIAEPWDIGPQGYQVGQWGPGWGEHNDQYRDYIRDFWRGDAPAGVRPLASRLAGSPDVFDTAGRCPAESINIITVHDGFTLRDLVSYDVKHNEANGEDNRDGSNDNRSWNCGAEGETNDPTILALRHRQARNLMLTMLMSTGTPHITAGDDIGRTQQGNNNAYCQDSPISWLNWTQAPEWEDLRSLTAQAIALREQHPILRPQTFRQHREILDDQGQATGRKEFAWHNGVSGEMTHDDWDDAARSTLGMYLCSADSHDIFLTIVHGGLTPTEWVLPPAPWASHWQIVLTSAEVGELPTQLLGPGDVVALPPRTALVLRGSITAP
ncbi:MAG: glycogen debranching protein GlgX [Propionibacteriaceae bacterium]